MSEIGIAIQPSSWRYESCAEPGFHEVISPENSPCRITWVFRLNLPVGESYSLEHDSLELNVCALGGEVRVTHEPGKRAAGGHDTGKHAPGRQSIGTHGTESHELRKRDSFYLPAGDRVRLTALSDAFMMIGGGPYEGIGEFFVRSYDAELPLGPIRQVHGEPPYQRDVFLTVDPDTPASRILCGITSGEPGKWTSWPPHQHSADLEEVYCYFDIPHPYFGLHLASRRPGDIEAVLPVRTGDCVVIPEGYHPTVAAPGVTSSYYWVMVAHRRESRRYDLAKADFL